MDNNYLHYHIFYNILIYKYCNYDLLNFRLYYKNHMNHNIFDMYYLKDRVNTAKLEKCISEFILIDRGMKENNMLDVISRINRTFRSNRYRNRLAKSDKNWLGIDVDEALNGIMTYVTEI